MSDRCDAIEPLHSAWLDGVLAPVDARRVAAHVGACRTCRSEVEALDRTRRLLGNLPVRRVPSTLLAGPATRRPPERGRRPGAAAWMATAVAVLGGGLVGAAYAVGGTSDEAVPTVRVPVEVYVADHLVRTVSDQVASPLVVAGP